MAPRHFQLRGADADWFERTRPAIPSDVRYSILLLAIEMVGELEQLPPDTALLARTEFGTVLWIERREADGKVLVKILGTRGGIVASFSFLPDDIGTGVDRRSPTGLTWEQDAAPLHEATSDRASGGAFGPIEDLGLPSQVAKALRRVWVRTIETLVEMTTDELRRVPRIGEASIRAIDDALGLRNLRRNER